MKERQVVVLGIKHLHNCLDGKYFILLADHRLLKGFFHGNEDGLTNAPGQLLCRVLSFCMYEIVCKVKANVDVLPLATAEIESLKKERTSPPPAKGRGSLDTTCAVCTIHAIVHSEAKNYIKCTGHFLPKIFVEVMRT